MEKLLIPDNVKTIEDFNKWLKPFDKWYQKFHPLNINVEHIKSKSKAFNFHINKSGFDGNIYYHSQQKNGFQKCKFKSMNRIFKFTYEGTNTSEKPSKEQITEWENYNIPKNLEQFKNKHK